MSDWRKILIEPTESLERAIQILHDGGCRIVLVVDECDKLLGTVTDGDIRRALINQLTMESEVSLIMNDQPITVGKEFSRQETLSLMSSKGLMHMPIVDNDGILLGLETLQHMMDRSSYENPVFLMAGGFGTRLYPLTKDTPKPLLHVGDKPILEIIILQFVDAGFHNFFISVHFKSEMIQEYFGDGSKWGVSIKYICEASPLGTAGSLGLLPDDLPNLPIVIMNGDLLTKVNFEHLLDFHNNNNGVATMCVREYDFQVPYGVIETECHSILSITEKPVHSFFVNAGIYVIDLQLVDQVDGKGYLDMTSLLEQCIKSGLQVKSFPIHEYWLDIGRLEEFEKANNEISFLQ